MDFALRVVSSRGGSCCSIGLLLIQKLKLCPNRSAGTDELYLLEIQAGESPVRNSSAGIYSTAIASGSDRRSF